MFIVLLNIYISSDVSFAKYAPICIIPQPAVCCLITTNSYEWNDTMKFTIQSVRQNEERLM